MDEKNLMENLLLVEKGVCDLLMHGAIESATPPVRAAFDSALSESLAMQKTLYDKMAARGWYPSEMAQSSEISKVKNKFAKQA